MLTPFDPAKDAVNVVKHGISLKRAFDMDPLAFRKDERADYGEPKWRAWGLIDGQAYCLVYTVREGRVSPISLRRAHAKEMKHNVP